MTASTPTARDECMQLIQEVADTYGNLYVRYPGMKYEGTPPGVAPWWWVQMIHTPSRQASLAGATGKRRWRHEGIITVMCFGLDFNQAEEMSIALRNKFQKATTPGDVWFRGATSSEVAPDSSWYRFDFQVTFQYDEVR